jgi:transcriptional regulator with XRE-family HTH domain
MRYDLALQRIMKQTRVSQAELARRAELTPAYISDLVNGVCDNPSTEALRAIGKALSVPPELLALFGAEAHELRDITPEVAAMLAEQLLGALMAKPKKGKAS